MRGEESCCAVQMGLSKKALECYCADQQPADPKVREVMEQFLASLRIIEANTNFLPPGARPSSSHQGLGPGNSQLPQQPGVSSSAAGQAFSTSYSYSGEAVPNRQHDLSGQGLSDDSSRESSPKPQSPKSQTQGSQSADDQGAPAESSGTSSQDQQSCDSFEQDDQGTAADTVAQSDEEDEEGLWEGSEPWMEEVEQSQEDIRAASDHVGAILAIWFRFWCWAWSACKSSAAFSWMLISGKSASFNKLLCSAFDLVLGADLTGLGC